VAIRCREPQCGQWGELSHQNDGRTQRQGIGTVATTCHLATGLHKNSTTRYEDRIARCYVFAPPPNNAIIQHNKVSDREVTNDCRRSIKKHTKLRAAPERHRSRKTLFEGRLPVFGVFGVGDHQQSGLG
jgi:hypothetical protein